MIDPPTADSSANPSIPSLVIPSNPNITPMPAFQTYVTFPSPFTLSLPIPTGARPRVISPDETQPPARASRGFSKLPLVIRFDAQYRSVLAYLPPIPQPLVIYGPLDFEAACADTMDGHAQRVLELCGNDPAAVLQPIIDDLSTAWYSRPAPARCLRLLTLSKLKLILVLEAAGLEDAFFAFLASDPKMQRRWDAAQLLAFSNPLVMAAIPVFAAATHQPESAITSILLTAAS